MILRRLPEGTTLISSLTELGHSLLQQWPMLPQTMHYWYFNIINPKKDFVTSYILARTPIPVKLNNRLVNPQGELYYTTVLADFPHKKQS